MSSDTALSREVEIDPQHAALLFIDVQNYTARPDGGEYAHLSDGRAGGASTASSSARCARRALPNMQRLQAACRAGGIEVMYTVIESLTLDGRDRSLDYKISGLQRAARLMGRAGARRDRARPSDEIVLPKTSSSVFISTNIDYVLRNLGVRSLIIAGLLTDQCIDSAIRDACDLGYLVTCPTDACATLSQDRHDWSLRNNRGYCRQITTAALVEEIERLTAR